MHSASCLSLNVRSCPSVRVGQKHTEAGNEAEKTGPGGPAILVGVTSLRCHVFGEVHHAVTHV